MEGPKEEQRPETSNGQQLSFEIQPGSDAQDTELAGLNSAAARGSAEEAGNVEALMIDSSDTLIETPTDIAQTITECKDSAEETTAAVETSNDMNPDQDGPSLPAEPADKPNPSHTSTRIPIITIDASECSAPEEAQPGSINNASPLLPAIEATKPPHCRPPETAAFLSVPPVHRRRRSQVDDEESSNSQTEERAPSVEETGNELGYSADYELPVAADNESSTRRVQWRWPRQGSFLSGDTANSPLSQGSVRGRC